jgi:opacity protein-like surface antigen
MNGFELSAIYNFNRYLGSKADFSAHFKKELMVTKHLVGIDEWAVDTRLYQYMVGPELKIPNDSILTPFGYALVGGAHSSITITTLVNASNYSFGVGSKSRNGITRALGGGFDLRLSDCTSVRYTIDYNPTRARVFRPEDQSQNNVRTSVGILFH